LANGQNITVLIVRGSLRKDGKQKNAVLFVTRKQILKIREEYTVLILAE